MNNICETEEVTGNLRQFPFNIYFSSTFDLQDKVFSLFDQFEKVSDQCFDMEALPSSSKQVKAIFFFANLASWSTGSQKLISLYFCTFYIDIQQMGLLDGERLIAWWLGV